MLFKPQWYKLLADNLKPLNDVLDKLESCRKRIGLDHNIFAELVLQSPESIKRLQYELYREAQLNHPSLRREEILLVVLISRINVRRIMSWPAPTPLELKAVLHKSRTIEDICNYIIEIETKEDGLMYDPQGYKKAVADILKTSFIIQEICKEIDSQRDKTKIERIPPDNKRYFDIRFNDYGIDCYEWGMTKDKVEKCSAVNHLWKPINVTKESNVGLLPGTDCMQVLPGEGNILGYRAAVGFYFDSGGLNNITCSVETVPRGIINDSYFLSFNKLCLECGIPKEEVVEDPDRTLYRTWANEHSLVMSGLVNGAVSIQFYKKEHGG